MCKIYNTIGSLTSLKSELEKSHINDFKSLKEVLDFRNSYSTSRKQLIDHHEMLIDQEKNSLTKELELLEKTIENNKQHAAQRLTDEIDALKQQLGLLKLNIPTNFFGKLLCNLKVWRFNAKINHKENNFDNEVKASISNLVSQSQIKNNRYQFVSTQYKEAIQQSVQHDLTNLDRKKKKLDELNSFIIGALGEQRVARTLEGLSDDYFLINDFHVTLTPPIYHRKENYTISSVQIDHILIAPSGIFLIETKNWSENSMENLSLRSPVQQVKRASFVLYKLLNNEMSNFRLRLERHHWGDKKIPIKNLIVMINSKPLEAFQYVKVLTLMNFLAILNTLNQFSQMKKHKELLTSSYGLMNKKLLKQNDE